MDLVSARELIRYGNGKLRPALERALEQLDAVHLVPANGRSVALRAVQSKSHHTLTYTPRQALLVTTYPYSEKTWVESIIQCFGYHLDLCLAPSADFTFDYASKAPKGPFAEIVALALDSPPAQEIRQMAAFWEGPRKGTPPAKAKSHRDGWLQLLEPHYLFSRAYRQWVIARAESDADLLAEMLRPRRARDDEQRWSVAEFAPIHAAFDRAFRQLDWLSFERFQVPRSRRTSALAERLAA